MIRFLAVDEAESKLARSTISLIDRTFAKGETGEFKVGTNTFPIRVIDISEKSVAIEREGQRYELPLLENLLPLDGKK